MINKKGNQSDRTICAMNSRLQRADRQSLSKDNDSRPRASVFERLGSRHVSPLSSPQPQHHSNYYHDNNSHQHYRSNSKHRRGTVVSPAQQSASSSSFHGEYELHSRRSDEYHSTPQYHRNSSRSAGSTVALDINLSRSSRHSNHSADKISTRLPSMITHPMVCTSNNGSHNSHPGQSNPSSNHSQSKK